MEDGGLSFTVASVMEDVLQQHGNGLRNHYLESRRAEEAVTMNANVTPGFEKLCSLRLLCMIVFTCIVELVVLWLDRIRDKVVVVRLKVKTLVEMTPAILKARLYREEGEKIVEKLKALGVKVKINIL
ncbi:Ribosomal protein L7/L12 C-terminal [Arabidopsis suecica]|uniref:Ribosomal protein L7/L12 C-terminal n=1 Tax=Arabidopsis suecica TaxID=45249 RepID=A0A8T2AHI0_ARASU|nr:Ribosomal protein L7/L12 C-terminal [Arabidopsis suecica]